jgi:hypothetical protein
MTAIASIWQRFRVKPGTVDPLARWKDLRLQAALEMAGVVG